MRLAHARRSPRPETPASERGAAGAEVLPFAVLIFVFGTLLLVNAWGVIDAKFAVTSAAREAARSYAESGGGLTAEGDAREAAESALAAYGRKGDRLELDGPRGALERCGTITYTATYPVPAIKIPVIGGFGHAFDVTSTHSTRVDQLRAGLAGDAQC